MSKWILLAVVLAIAVVAAVLSNPDWRGKMADPGGLIGSIKPRKDVLTASKSDPGSRVQLPSPTISIGDDAGGHSASAGSQALGGTYVPSPSTISSAPASSTASPTAPANAARPPRLPATAAPSLSAETTGQLNAILKSRETKRGLVTMLPNALFEPGSALLGTAGNDKLSRIARVILAHPGVKVEVDGYTGPADVFQSGLSAGRAASVRLFLVTQGVNERDVTQRSVTVPPTETAAGAELSRDVALVISGPSR